MSSSSDGVQRRHGAVDKPGVSAEWEKGMVAGQWTGVKGR